MRDAEFVVPRLKHEEVILTLEYRGAGPNGEDITLQFGPMPPIVAHMLEGTLSSVPVAVPRIGPPTKAGGL
jgi:hypothetical protein